MAIPVLLIQSNNGIKVESELFLLDNSPVKVGRDSTADLRLPDPFISRTQAELFSSDGKWFIRDDKSKNGTFVNGTKVGAEKVELKQGDVISFSKKIDFLFQENDWEEGETRSISIPMDKYGVRIDEKTQDVYVDDVKISPRLGQMEWQFLLLLMKEPDRIHTYKELAKEMYSIQEDIFAIDPYKTLLHTIKNDISKKFRKQGITREVIKSRSSVGYLLVEKETDGK